MPHFLFMSQPSGSVDSRPTDAKAAGDAKPADTKPGDKGTAETQPADHPPAPAGGCGGLMAGPGQYLIFLLPLALILLMNRSSTKKQREIESNIKVGDRVVTKAGAIGKVVDVGDRIIKVELAPGVNVQFLKSAIEGIDAGDPKPDAKKEAEKKDAEKKEADKKADAKAEKDAKKAPAADVE